MTTSSWGFERKNLKRKLGTGENDGASAAVPHVQHHDLLCCADESAPRPKRARTHQDDHTGQLERSGQHEQLAARGDSLLEVWDAKEIAELESQIKLGWHFDQ